MISRVVAGLGEAALVAPDAGARKRVQTLAKQLGGLPVVFAEKVRDTRTGEIVATSIVGELPNRNLLVVDDICDGGRTFIELAAALKDKQAAQGLDKPLFLYVTHGIFSKGLDVLTPLYKQVFTPNDWTGAANDALTILR
jgi:ribose-phosphate pyrophosphokinase